LWAEEAPEGAVKTVQVHVSRLRQKIDKPFPTPLIHTVRNAGYILRAESV
jgi:DNA-binding response OmpR family regulator